MGSHASDRASWVGSQLQTRAAPAEGANWKCSAGLMAKSPNSTKKNRTVSVIIPTHNRPSLVLRAVRSALAQSYCSLEVVVVIDGPDRRTASALASIADSRLRVHTLPRASGAQVARNTAIEMARGDWIALLDDDDEWLPLKIEMQMKRAIVSSYRYPIISCRFNCRTRESQLIWPRRLPSKPLCEYLLARNGLSMGEGMLNTITLMFPKDLWRFQPFTPTLKRCQEVDWILRASQHDGVGIEFLPQALAVLHREEDHSGITSTPDWRASLEWVDTVRPFITPRAYSSYVAITVGSQAARQSEWRAIPKLLLVILGRGKPKLRDIAFFISVWIVPRRVQLLVRRLGW